MGALLQWRSWRKGWQIAGPKMYLMTLRPRARCRQPTNFRPPMEGSTGGSRPSHGDAWNVGM